MSASQPTTYFCGGAWPASAAPTFPAGVAVAVLAAAPSEQDVLHFNGEPACWEHVLAVFPDLVAAQPQLATARRAGAALAVADRSGATTIRVIAATAQAAVAVSVSACAATVLRVTCNSLSTLGLALTAAGGAAPGGLLSCSCDFAADLALRAGAEDAVRAALEHAAGAPRVAVAAHGTAVVATASAADPAAAREALRRLGFVAQEHHLVPLSVPPSGVADARVVSAAWFSAAASRDDVVLRRALADLIAAADAAPRPTDDSGRDLLDLPGDVLGQLGLQWWRPASVRRALQSLVRDGHPRYVYDLATLRTRARAVKRALSCLHATYYAMKANPHPALLRAVAAEGFGIECVSANELRAARAATGAATPLLFTPNFAPLAEYEVAFELGADVTVDGPEVLAQAPELFRGRALALRVDPGTGRGHHEKVKTAGPGQKFGLELTRVAEFAAAAAALGVRVVGLHAHAGSGICDPGAWVDTARTLQGLVEAHFGDARWVDVGGGLGVVNREGDAALPLAALNAALEPVARELAARSPPVHMHMEPGRYLVSEAGVLLNPVTQVREKGGLLFVGAATGMNALIRPALYGSYHAIYNLSRMDRAAAAAAVVAGDDAVVAGGDDDDDARPHHVVGPICETGDVLGKDRGAELAGSRPGDVLLLANAGAYGRVMASEYNLRFPPVEEVVDSVVLREEATR